MKNKLLLLAGVATLATFAYTHNAKAVDVTGNATANIATTLTLIENTAMDFADIFVDALVTDTVTMAPTGAIASAGGTSTFGGTTAAGNFTATGSASTPVTIAFSTGDTLVNGPESVSLTNFVHDAGVTPTITAGGSLNFNVGADLAIAVAQVPGVYTGTYTVSVNY